MHNKKLICCTHSTLHAFLLSHMEGSYCTSGFFFSFIVCFNDLVSIFFQHTCILPFPPEPKARTCLCYCVANAQQQRFTLLTLKQSGGKITPTPFVSVKMAATAMH